MMKNLLTILLISCCGILSAQNYRIGDLYTAPDGSQGIVYYLLPDGSGGWVVALNDASTGCPWGTTTDVPGLTNLNPSYFYINLLIDTAGYANTQTIRSYQNNNTTYAAGVVDFVNGWYLPSLAQISMLYAQRPFIADAIIAAGGTNLAYDAYWCSDERDATYGWYIRNCGAFEPVDKTTHCRVRAVRSFSYDAPQLSYSWSTGANTQDITVIPTQTTTYAVTVSTPGGCADTVEHTIVVGEPINEEISQTACDSYEWGGQTYTQSGDYTTSFTHSGGCDSVVTLHLTISSSVNEEINQTTCDSYEWNGQTYTQSGDYMYSYQRTNGCDSVVTLHLTLHSTPVTTITSTADTLCENGEVTLQTETTVSYLGPSHVPSVAIGDILCADNSIVKPADWPVEGKTAQGIVFYVDNTGEHGWAVHLQNQGMGIKWSTLTYYDIPTLANYNNTPNAITDTNGYHNTQEIRNTEGADYFPAAYAVDYDNGWYLPAAGQLRLLYSTIVTLNSSLQIVGGTQFPMNSTWAYWTSTENGTQNAFCMTGYGLVTQTGKGSANNAVRSVRSF